MLTENNLLNSAIKSTVKRYNPEITGVTGTIGKSLIVGAISKFLTKNREPFIAMPTADNSIRSMQKTLLGFSIGKSAIYLYLRASKRALLSGRYPRNIILEYPLLGQKDIRARLSIMKPNVLIVGGVHEFPPNIELYRDRDALIKDIKNMVEKVGRGERIILNSDEDALMEMTKDNKASIITYGFNKESDVRISNFENRNESGKPVGISFKLEYDGSFVPIKIDNIFGKFYAYAIAATVAFAISRGTNLVKATELISSYQGGPGRGKLIPGIKDTLIIDDTYDSSLVGSVNALETLRDLPSKRRIAVLGDIIGVGEHTEDVHLKLGEICGDIADVIFTVGPRAKFIEKGITSSNNKNKPEVFSYDSSEEAMSKIQGIIRPGDLILIKGSKFMEMEKIVLEIMAEPQKAKDLLVKRQKININGH